MTEHRDEHKVTLNESQHRFEVEVNGRMAFLQYYLSEGSIVFTHTKVPAEMEGQGIGGSLARAGLEHARREGLSVIPLCPFIEDYLRRHPREIELVEAGYRKGMAT